MTIAFAENTNEKELSINRLVWRNLGGARGECLTAVLQGFRMLEVGEGEQTLQS